MGIDNFLKDLFQAFLSYQEINLRFQLVTRNGTIYKSKILRKNLIEQETSQCRLFSTCQNSSVRHSLGYTNFDTALKGDYFILISQNCFINALEEFAFSACSRSLLSQIVDTKDHIL